MIYIYESHLGGYYASNVQLDYDELYCEECGDVDTFVGKYDPASVGDALRFALDMSRAAAHAICGAAITYTIRRAGQACLIAIFGQLYYL